MKKILTLLSAFLLSGGALAADRPDVLIADFEGESYSEGWKITGTAFGNGPAKGTLPNQMAVTGFLGKGLVNSYRGGDDSTGTLTSPEFKIERNYLNFLIGGGKHPGKACINLIVDGKAVRTATGPNDKPGGTEHLDWQTWDVTDLAGKTATIQIVDEQKGGWGHINIDHIVQGDKKKTPEPFAAEFKITSKYLHLPVKTGAPMRRMAFKLGKEIVREFDIELDVSEKPQFWAFADVSPFLGKTLVVSTMLPADSRLPGFAESDDVPDTEKLYREKHRPLFHFTSRFGWLNDPNGLVFHNGEWHLFYQHNPFGVNWGNMHWGHAVSMDLFRWKELGIGLYPKKYGDMAFSGSAVLDKGNTSGWGTEKNPPLVLAYTSTGRGECIAWSDDDGRTWTEYDKNPVVKHSGRDPKLVWYEKGRHWVMAVYDEHDKKQWIAFHTSKDLKTWEFASRIEGFFECPDLFELNGKWVLYAADGKYVLGEFDGKAFKPEHKEKKQLWQGNFYAAQTFDSAPGTVATTNGSVQAPGLRRVQIGWANGVTFPNMPFNQQMTVPVELKLVGDRLTAEPAEEIKKLRGAEYTATESTFPSKDGNVSFLFFPSMVKVAGRLVDFSTGPAFDLECELDISTVASAGFKLHGTPLIYDVKKGTLTCKNVTAVVKPEGKLLKLRILVDRGSIEVFADGGKVAMSIAAIPVEKSPELEVVGQGGDLKLKNFRVSRIESVWAK